MTQTKSEPPGNLLWHYTSFDGLHGIITKGEIFASSLPYLNDTKEFLYTCQPLLDALENGEFSLDDTVLGRTVGTVLPFTKEILDQIKGQNVYVACFSKEGDDLSQWRSYTPRPPGFAIGFDPVKLAGLGRMKKFNLVECAYLEPADVVAEVQKHIAAAMSAVKQEKNMNPTPISGDNLRQFLDLWVGKLVETVATDAPKNKHPKFKAEKEVRLVGKVGIRVNDLDQAEFRMEICYRQAGSLVVPYVKIPLSHEKWQSPIR